MAMLFIPKWILCTLLKVGKAFSIIACIKTDHTFTQASTSWMGMQHADGYVNVANRHIYIAMLTVLVQ